jgi:hypothetical protein
MAALPAVSRFHQGREPYLSARRVAEGLGVISQSWQRSPALPAIH